MRSLKVIFCLLLLGSVLFSSCGTKSASDGTGQLALIPSNANVVFEVKGKDILSKSGLNKPDDYKFMSFLKMFGGDVSPFVESLLKGSDDAGISIEKITAYLVGVKSFVVTIKILDKNVFEKWMGKFGFSDIKKSGDLAYLEYFGLYFVWNSKYLTLYSGGKIDEADLADFMLEKTNGLLAENEDFKQFAAKPGDIKTWVKNTAILDIMGKVMPDVAAINEAKMLDDITKLSIHSCMEFNDGKIVGSSEISPADEFEKFMKKYPAIKDKFNRDLFKNLPENPYLTLNMAINFKETFKTFKSIFSNFDALSQYSRLPDNKKKEFEKFMESKDVQTVVDALDGDFLLGIYGFNQGAIPYPLLNAVFTVKNEKAFNDLLDLLPKEIYKKTDNYYTVSKLDKDFSVYFAYKDNNVMITDDLKSIENFTGKAQGKTFLDNTVSEKFAAQQAAFYLNLDFDSYPEYIKSLLANNIGQFVAYINIYESFYVVSNNNKTEGALVFKNKSVNSLKQILKNLDDNIMSGSLLR